MNKYTNRTSTASKLLKIYNSTYYSAKDSHQQFSIRFQNGMRRFQRTVQLMNNSSFASLCYQGHDSAWLLSQVSLAAQRACLQHPFVHLLRDDYQFQAAQIFERESIKSTL
ncbi:hypothetical protein FGO68_gene11047 [Halteria grandinella]|uniref:Uncharacterized protein n=1 Tax=Halteria grandinella TaxID=5974 RepID=A0A8J8NDI1_HALGN|nr:hypothetical protein FGO68_gene11047 [Halteria grandinella]